MKFTTILYTLASYAVPAMALQSSTYVFADNGANITLSLTAAADTKDLFFRLSTPTAYDWVAVGIGASMKGALTLIAYPAKDGKSMTLSPRLSTGNSEPTYNKNIDCKLAGDSNPNLGDQVVLSIICRDAVHWSNPPLDLTSSKAPFMWAIGRPTYKNGSLWTNSPSADLRSHSAFAQFTMDMTQATVPSNPNSTIPDLGNSTSGASAVANVIAEHDYMSPGHAIAIFVALLILVPLDSILRLFIKTVKFHIFMYILISAIFFVGAGLGFAISGQYNRTKKYNTAHQVLGLMVFILFIAQIPLGFFAHRRDQATRQARQAASDTDPLTSTPTPRRKRNPLSLAHILIGTAILLLAIINGGLGFNLALTTGYNLQYSVVVVAIFIVWLGISGLRYMWSRRNKDDIEAEEHARKTQAAIQAYQMQHMQNDESAAYPPPSYGAQAQYPAVSLPRSY